MAQKIDYLNLGKMGGTEPMYAANSLDSLVPGDQNVVNSVLLDVFPPCRFEPDSKTRLPYCDAAVEPADSLVSGRIDYFRRF